LSTELTHTTQLNKIKTKIAQSL